MHNNFFQLNKIRKLSKSSTKGKSIVTLGSSSNKTPIDSYKVNHSIKRFSKSININKSIFKSGGKSMRKILFGAYSNIIAIVDGAKQSNDIEAYYKKGVMKITPITPSSPPVLQQNFSFVKAIR